MNYEYKFEKIKLKGAWWSNKPDRDYHDIIAKYAEDGWRFVQIFAPATSGYGAASYFELIFERPVN
jgi:hypothetical protein